MIGQSIHRQGGFSLVTAVFLLVVLGMMGAYIVTLGSVQRTTTSYAVMGARAYSAARSGLEWAVFRAVNPGTMAATCGAAPLTPTVNNFNLSGVGVDGFGVTVTCSYTRHQERSDCFNVYDIVAVAQYGNYGQLNFFSRRTRATVTDAPGTGCP